MPFKSKAQQRYFYAAEDRGDLPKGTAEEWSKETDFEGLPERAKKKKKKEASYYELGQQAAIARYLGSKKGR